ncbi:endo-1,4-beta-xylanase [Flavobacterium sp. UW10123]|uniref:endo-1,4-beta-xylanase n=1 Tax=Flavobacterium sp. UW10123 TaxID=3230800 RepID=UPI0033984B96
MNKLYKMAMLFCSTAAIWSCANDSVLDFEYAKPESIANQEKIDAYKDLKTYVDRSRNPDFKLGAGISISEYVSGGIVKRLVDRNFDEITMGYEMKHGAVVKNDGTFDFSGIDKLLAASRQSGVTVFGHTLCWHSNQNATYLKSLIAPVIIPSTGGPSWDLVTGNDFETDNTSNYQVNSNVTAAYTAVGGGPNGSGRALKLTNAAVRANDWEAQLFIKFSPAVQAGEKYQLSMDVRSDVDASYSTQAHVTPGAYKHWDFFGTISSTPTWTTYTKEITVSAEQATCGAIAFNLGKTATTYYFDNITLKKYNPTGGSTIIEKTPEEKKNIINQSLEKWISEMVKTCAPTVKAWDVVNEPMDDGNPYELKTGIGKTLAADEFFWQDYLGKDYAVEAFRLARKYGNPTDKLFINDYNLEYNLDKCRGLIKYVEYVESKGQKVDGIATQMHININSNKESIATMFQLLATTGKLIKVSELDIALGTGDANEVALQKQAEMYKYVIDMYSKYIPAKQRYGITVWGVTDSSKDSSWLPGENQALWNIQFTRKPAYARFADGLNGMK